MLGIAEAGLGGEKLHMQGHQRAEQTGLYGPAGFFDEGMAAIRVADAQAHPGLIRRRNHFCYGCRAVADGFFHQQMDACICDLFADGGHLIVTYSHQRKVDGVLGQQPGQIVASGLHFERFPHFGRVQRLLVLVPEENSVDLRRLGQRAQVGQGVGVA